MGNVMQPNQKREVGRLVGAIFVVILVALAGYFGWKYWSERQNSAKQKQEVLLNQSQDIAGPKPAGNVVKTKAEVVTRCYTFTVERTIAYGPIDDCNIELTYGSNVANKLITKPGYPVDIGRADFSQSKTFVDGYKAYLQKTYDVIKAEEVKLGGEPGGLFVIQDRTTKQVSAQVIANSKQKHQVGNNQVSDVYHVVAAYYTDEQKQVLQGVIDSWQWK